MLLSSVTCKAFWVPLHGLLILLLLFWPYASLGAGFVLYCWLLSNKIIQQDRIGVQERCRPHLGKNYPTLDTVSADENTTLLH